MDEIAVIDETARNDISDVALLRGLGAVRIRRLAAAVTGTGTGRHDRPALLSANALILAAAAIDADPAFARTSLAELCFDAGRILALLAALERCGAARPATARPVADTGDLPPAGALVYALPGQPFALSRSQIVDALAFVHFLLVADAAAQIGEVTAVLDAVDPADGDSAGRTTRALARIAYDYRKRHFPQHDLLRRHGRLLDALGGTGRKDDPNTRSARFSDAEILAAWTAEIAAGERSLFETVVRTCVALERALQSPRMADGDRAEKAYSDFADPTSLDRPHQLWDDYTDDDDAPTPQDWLRAVPEHPNVLTGPERDRLATLFGLDPVHRDRRLTALRALAFGAEQKRLAGRHGRLGALAPDEIGGDDYAAVLRQLDEDVRHLGNVAVSIVEAGDGPHRDGLPRAQRIRRRGFDLPPEAFAAALRPAMTAIAGLLSETREFARAAARHAAAYPADRPVFTAAFQSLYARPESQNDRESV
ncbi:hypothetical protein [Methylobrevis albus]|uniref:Uncharacterized protein n=1 Tax=Methylobrevis albus TaxID=2793297 RepID=A0A931I011_9HYPH|nr:hypothetical protein [Methylobrevis albus]MBH0236849.1 hypothetical protein [Methylobrevis albus]